MIKNISTANIKDFNKLGLQINKNFNKVFDLETILLAKYNYLYGYYNHETLIGFIHVIKIYETIDIVNIVVDKSFQRKGIASKLIEHIIKKFTDVNQILLEVNENNTPAINLYKKYDFKIINQRKKYYGKDTALIMERDEVNERH